MTTVVWIDASPSLHPTPTSTTTITTTMAAAIDNYSSSSRKNQKERSSEGAKPTIPPSTRGTMSAATAASGPLRPLSEMNHHHHHHNHHRHATTRNATHLDGWDGQGGKTTGQQHTRRRGGERVQVIDAGDDDDDDNEIHCERGTVQRLREHFASLVATTSPTTPARNPNLRINTTTMSNARKQWSKLRSPSADDVLLLHSLHQRKTSTSSTASSYSIAAATKSPPPLRSSWKLSAVPIAIHSEEEDEVEESTAVREMDEGGPSIGNGKEEKPTVGKSSSNPRSGGELPADPTIVESGGCSGMVSVWPPPPHSTSRASKALQPQPWSPPVGASGELTRLPSIASLREKFEGMAATASFRQARGREGKWPAGLERGRRSASATPHCHFPGGSAMYSRELQGQQLLEKKKGEEVEGPGQLSSSSSASTTYHSQFLLPPPPDPVHSTQHSMGTNPQLVPQKSIPNSPKKMEIYSDGKMEKPKRLLISNEGNLAVDALTMRDAGEVTPSSPPEEPCTTTATSANKGWSPAVTDANTLCSVTNQPRERIATAIVRPSNSTTITTQPRVASASTATTKPQMAVAGCCDTSGLEEMRQFLRKMAASKGKKGVDVENNKKMLSAVTAVMGGGGLERKKARVKEKEVRMEERMGVAQAESPLPTAEGCCRFPETMKAQAASEEVKKEEEGSDGAREENTSTTATTTATICTSSSSCNNNHSNQAKADPLAAESCDKNRREGHHQQQQDPSPFPTSKKYQPPPSPRVQIKMSSTEDRGTTLSAITASPTASTHQPLLKRKLRGLFGRGGGGGGGKGGEQEATVAISQKQQPKLSTRRSSDYLIALEEEKPHSLSSNSSQSSLSSSCSSSDDGEIPTPPPLFTTTTTETGGGEERGEKPQPAPRRRIGGSNTITTTNTTQGGWRSDIDRKATEDEHHGATTTTMVVASNNTSDFACNPNNNNGHHGDDDGGDDDELPPCCQPVHRNLLSLAMEEDIPLLLESMSEEFTAEFEDYSTSTTTTTVTSANPNSFDSATPAEKMPRSGPIGILVRHRRPSLLASAATASTALQLLQQQQQQPLPTSSSFTAAAGGVLDRSFPTLTTPSPLSTTGNAASSPIADQQSIASGSSGEESHSPSPHRPIADANDGSRGGAGGGKKQLRFVEGPPLVYAYPDEDTCEATMVPLPAAATAAAAGTNGSSRSDGAGKKKKSGGSGEGNMGSASFSAWDAGHHISFEDYQKLLQSVHDDIAQQFHELQKWREDYSR